MYGGQQNTGYLGGEVPMSKRFELRDKYITPLNGVDLGLHAQCRCGGTVYAKWRGRWHCKACARWVRSFRATIVAVDDIKSEGGK